MDRVALDLGIVKIYWYGIVVTFGMLCAVWVAMRQFGRRGMDPNIVSDGAIWVIGLGLVGARLYHVFSTPNDGSGVGWAYYRENPIDIFKIWNGGIGIYGGVAGGVIAIAFIMWRNRIQLFRAFDCIAPGVLLGQAIGRWGNFFNQELYGGPTGSSWFGLIIQPQNRIRTGKFDFTDLSTYPPETRFHPTFLYESVWNLIGFALLVWLARRFQENPGVLSGTTLRANTVPAVAESGAVTAPTTASETPVHDSISLIGTHWPTSKVILHDGDIGPLYLIWYALGRAWVELGFRPDAWTIAGLPTAVWVSALLLAVAIALLLLNRIKRNRDHVATKSSITQPIN